MTVNRFYPERDLTRLVYLRRGALILPLLIGAVLLGLLKYSYSLKDIVIGVLIIFVILLWLVLTSKFTTEIEIDAERRKLIISYFTLLTTKRLELPIDSLVYTLKHSPSLRDAKYWSLNFYTKNRKAFQLDNRHGYSQSVLKSVADELERLQVARKK